MKNERYFTQEQTAWIRDHWINRGCESNLELANQFNQTFNTKRTVHQIEGKASKIKKNENVSYTAYFEEDKWICDNYYKYSRQGFIRAFNERFNKNVGRSIENRAIILLKNNNLYKGARPKSMHDRIYWNDSMVEWLMENKPKMTTKELLENFNKTFNKNVLHYDGLKTMVYRHGRSLGEVKLPVSDIDSKVVKAPIGTIVKLRHLYYIKIKNMSSREVREWRIKNGHTHHEGVISDPRFVRLDLYNLGYTEMPKDKFIVHLDGNWENCEKENLALVNKRIAIKIWKNGWNKQNPEIAKVGIEVAKACLMIEDYEKGELL